VVARGIDAEEPHDLKPIISIFTQLRTTIVTRLVLKKDILFHDLDLLLSIQEHMDPDLRLSIIRFSPVTHLLSTSLT